MSAYGESAATELERFDLGGRRRAWGLALVLPFFLSLAFLNGEVRTLHPADGMRPTDIDGFDAPRYAVRSDPTVKTIRLGLGLLALLGLGVFATRSQGASVSVDRKARMIYVTGGPRRLNATVPLDGTNVITVKDDAVWLSGGGEREPLALADVGVDEEVLDEIRRALKG